MCGLFIRHHDLRWKIIFYLSAFICFFYHICLLHVCDIDCIVYIVRKKPKKISIHKKEILKGLSFEGKAGEILGIIGESGSGKSMTANSPSYLIF